MVPTTLKQFVERAGDHSAGREHAHSLHVGHPISTSFKIGRTFRSEDELLKSLMKDGPGEQSVAVPPLRGDKRKGKKKMGLTKILKNGASDRDTVADAMEANTAKLVAKGVPLIEAQKQSFDRAYALHESIPVATTLPVVKSESVQVSKANKNLDAKVAEIMKRDHIDEPHAMIKASIEAPELFQAVDAEKRAMQGEQVGQKMNGADGNGDYERCEHGKKKSKGKCKACKRKTNGNGNSMTDRRGNGDLADWDARPARGGVGTDMLATRKHVGMPGM